MTENIEYESKREKAKAYTAEQELSFFLEHFLAAVEAEPAWDERLTAHLNEARKIEEDLSIKNAAVTEETEKLNAQKLIVQAAEEKFDQAGKIEEESSLNEMLAKENRACAHAVHGLKFAYASLLESMELHKTFLRSTGNIPEDRRGERYRTEGLKDLFVTSALHIFWRKLPFLKLKEINMANPLIIQAASEVMALVSNVGHKLDDEFCSRRPETLVLEAIEKAVGRTKFLMANDKRLFVKPEPGRHLFLFFPNFFILGKYLLIREEVEKTPVFPMAIQGGVPYLPCRLHPIPISKARRKMQHAADLGNEAIENIANVTQQVFDENFTAAPVPSPNLAIFIAEEKAERIPIIDDDSAEVDIDTPVEQQVLPLKASTSMDCFFSQVKLAYNPGRTHSASKRFEPTSRKEASFSSI
jgi:hypothetical protein